MPPQLKLSDLLNILSIGILFQLIALFFLYQVDPQNILIHKIVTIDASLVIGLSIVLSFPCWRIISNFVEYIMYPITERVELTYAGKLSSSKGIKTTLRTSLKNIWIVIIFAFRWFWHWFKVIYRYVFFTMSKHEGVDKTDLVKSILATSKTNELTAKNIKQVFGLILTEVKEDEYRKIYHLIKSYLSVDSNVRDSLYSHRYNMVLNYHSRLAILCNIISIGSLIILIYNTCHIPNYYQSFFSFKENHFFYLLIGFYLSGRLFGSYCHEYAKRENELLIYDFNAMCAFKHSTTANSGLA